MITKQFAQRPSFASRLTAQFMRTFAALALFASKTIDPEDSYAYGAPAPSRQASGRAV